MSRGRTLLVAVLAAAVAACGGASADDAGSFDYTLSLEPDPPRVGPAKLSLRVADSAGAPVEAATIRIEGNMNHAGMVPVFADAQEVEPGRYAAELEFTMGGDWILTFDTTKDGRTDRWTRDVRGVRTD